MERYERRKVMSELAIQDLEQHQGQLDEDGCFVAVSRQALNETLDYIDSLRQELEEVKFALQVEEHDNEYNCAEKDRLKEDNERLRVALESIANSTCCDKCNQASLVAREALAPHIEKKHYEFTRNQIKCLYEACRFINKQSINFNLDFEVNFYELKEMFWKDLEELDYNEQSK
jgi:hypothetical protein